MYVTVSPSGSLTFRLDYRLNGRRETLTIGRYGACRALSRARQREVHRRQAGGQRGQLAGARQAAREAAPEGSEELWGIRREMAYRRPGWPTARARCAVRSSNETSCPRCEIGFLPKLRSDDLRVLCAKVKDRGAPATAVHVRDIVKLIYGFAILHGEKVPIRPRRSDQPRSPPLCPKDRSLSPTEIRVMLKQIEQCADAADHPARHALFLLTMVRKSELQDAIWDEVDFENAVWTIPKERMKRSKAHNVYLSQPVARHHDRAEDLRREFAIPVAVSL